MQGDVTVTVIGNATGDAELRFTQSGLAVANFTVATNPRRFNKASNAWEDGEATFYRVNVWRQHAENVAESVRRGDRVVVVGTLANRKYEAQDGGTRYSLEVTADAIALDTKWSIVTARKAERQQGGQGGYQQQGQQQGYGQGGQQRQDPWDQGLPAQQGYQPPAQGQQQAMEYQGAPANDPWGMPDPPPF